MGLGAFTINMKNMKVDMGQRVQAMDQMGTKEFQVIKHNPMLHITTMEEARLEK